MLECAEISADLDRRMQNVRDLDLISPNDSDYLYIIGRVKKREFFTRP